MPSSAHNLPHHTVHPMVNTLLIAHTAAAGFKQRSHDVVMRLPHLRPHGLLQQLVHAKHPPRPVNLHKPAAPHSCSNISQRIRHTRQHALSPRSFHVLLLQPHHCSPRSMRRQPAARKRCNSPHAALPISRHHLAAACQVVRLHQHVLHFAGRQRRSNTPLLRRAVAASANVTETSVQISASRQPPQLHVAALVRPLKQHTHAAVTMLPHHTPLHPAPQHPSQHPLPLHLNSSSIALKQQVAAPHVDRLPVFQPHAHLAALLHFAARSHTLQLQLRDAAALARNAHVPQRLPFHDNATAAYHQRCLLGPAPVKQRPRRAHGGAQREKREQLAALRLQTMRLQGVERQPHGSLQPARVLRSSP